MSLIHKLTDLGNIDIYLLDQLMRGRLRPGMRVLDAGCGGGRNIQALIRDGFSVTGVDHNSEAILHCERELLPLAPQADQCSFQVTDLQNLPFPDDTFDFIICNAVLHFSDSLESFKAITSECSRVLAPNGIFFSRLMTITGVEEIAIPVEPYRYLLPTGGFDSKPVFLADEKLLMEETEKTFQGNLADPIKSTLVHGKRTMTTWVVQKL